VYLPGYAGRGRITQWEVWAAAAVVLHDSRCVADAAGRWGQPLATACRVCL